MSTSLPRFHARRKAGLFSMLRHPGAIVRLLTDERAPTLPRVVAVLAVLYVLLPIDAIPDVIPILGWLDDLGIASFAFGYVLSQAIKFENARRLANEPTCGTLRASGC
jgi:uncharacterized membrane protein YkvA (DUF1232 family)